MHKHLERLTPLRFVAALFVVLFHFGRGVPPFNFPVINGVVLNGNNAVSFFYCLSGFIMATVYAGSDVSARSYWIARFARIYPVYLVCLLATYYLLGGTLTDLALTSALIQTWIPGSALAINTPGWSLSVEVFFYVLFPFLSTHVLSVSRKTLVDYTAALWICTQVITFVARTYFYGGYPSISHDLIFYFPLMHLNEFMIGIVTAVLFMDRARRGSSQMFASGIIALLAGIGLTTLVGGIAERFPLWVAPSNGLMAPEFAGIIWLVASLPNGIGRALESRALILLGESSYALYLMQEPLHIFFDRHLVPIMPDASATAKLFAFIALLVACSIAIYVIFEKPMRSLIKGLFRDRTAIAS
ncbi:acyltransferase [Trinickia violacea]|uniref:Acyltransferase n=1 Tax=Trinickia violacea TaxID=2571746 RepID=A0A4P8J3F4_9BURK|nr:acyltransferase [Trinickia violacea]QCP54394.1 acyltransferase [Trinickia violacea]